MKKVFLVLLWVAILAAAPPAARADDDARICTTGASSYCHSQCTAQYNSCVNTCNHVRETHPDMQSGAYQNCLDSCDLQEIFCRWSCRTDCTPEIF